VPITLAQPRLTQSLVSWPGLQERAR
jgi:hypothetical protein